MKTRLNIYTAAPEALSILQAQEKYFAERYADSAHLTKELGELLKLRVSQMNGCAYCLDMHTKDALRMGESVQRISALPAWREAPFYNEVERIALSWAECLTGGGAPDDAEFAEAMAVFGERGVFDLSLIVNAINSWNRIAKTFRPEVGSYQPAD